MIVRKTDKIIDEHYQKTGRALLLTGARQVGKTFSVRRFAERKGNFSTTGGESGLQDISSGAKASKYFHDGNLIIERNGIKYTPAGQKVK